MIRIVKYGNCGNVTAVKNTFASIGIESEITSNPAEVQRGDKLVLPGIGAYDAAIRSLKASGFYTFLQDSVADLQIDLLGICVGFQALANGSEEGNEEGLGFIDTVVKKFTTDSLPVPHMGWNSVILESDTELFKGVDLNLGFYFLHSYHFSSDTPGVLASANYPDKFCCAAASGKYLGVQFHPEKSHHNGQQVLKNFAEL